MGALQGYQLNSNDRGGLKVEYARARMGEPGKIRASQIAAGQLAMAGYDPSFAGPQAMHGYDPSAGMGYQQYGMGGYVM